jgi:hypothetical protein
MAPAAPVRDHCLAPSRADDAWLDPGGRYGRLFPDLSPLAASASDGFGLGDLLAFAEQ